MRLALFSPLPPTRSGIAAYTAELLPRLAEHHAVELFCATQPRTTQPYRTFPTFSAHDFVWKHTRTPYDLVVYQLGNAPCHDYMWPYLTRYPGLVVLHDGQLYHARARALLAKQSERSYRTEFMFDHPDAPIDVLELGSQGLLGHLAYLWPMLRLPVQASRMVAVHNTWFAEQLRHDFPEAAIETIRMGVKDPIHNLLEIETQRTTSRARLKLALNDIVFAVFGGMTPEKRLPQIIRAFATIVHSVPSARLMLVGAEASYYDVVADARAHGVDDRVLVTGHVKDTELDHYLTAVDICLCLRWPSGYETSASWLRCLAAGKPTVITDLPHLGDIAALVTRGTWMPSQFGSFNEHDAQSPEPVTISIDLLDEDRSLSIAMQRLALDNGLRRRLGKRARAYWSAHHQVEQMSADYERVLKLAIANPAPNIPRPFRENGTEQARVLLSSLNVILPDMIEEPQR